MIQAIQLINDLSTSLLVAWLNTGWGAILVVAAAFIYVRRSPRLNAATRYAVWWAVLAFITGAPIVYRLVNPPAPPPPDPLPIETAASPEPVTTVPFSTSAFDASPAPSPVVSLPWDWNAGRIPAVLVLIWAVVFALQGARVAWSYVWLAQLKRKARRAPAPLRSEFDEWVLATAVGRPVRLLVSDQVESPVAVGFRDAAVILPASLVDELDQQDLDHVLLHELAHIARRDDWTNLLARILTGVLAMNPLALLVLRRIDREREIACDDWVVTATGAAGDYAVSLSRLIEFRLEHRRTLLASGIAGRGTQLSDRISLLLQAGREFTSSISPLRAGAAIAVLVIAMAAGAAAPPWVVSVQEVTPEAPLPPEAPEPVAEPGPIAAPRAVRRAAVPRALPSPPARPFVGPASTVPPVAPSIIGPEPAPAPATTWAVAAPPQLPPAPPAPAAVPASAHSGTSFLAAVVASGNGDLAVDDIIELKNQGVRGDYLIGITRAWGKLPPKEIIALRTHSVSPDYAARVRAAGVKDMTIAGLIDMRQHGVDADDLREIHRLGFGPYTARQAIEFRNNGVRSDLFRALKDAGFHQPDPRDIIDARVHGVRAEHLREAAKIGSSLTIRQIIRLKNAGVI